MNLSNRLDTLESEVQMIMRLYQATAPLSQPPASAATTGKMASLASSASSDATQQSGRRKALELNKGNIRSDQHQRPSSEKKSLTKKLMNLKQGSSLSQKSSVSCGTPACDEQTAQAAASSPADQLKQQATDQPKPSNKYSAFKNCLNSIKDTLTKGGDCASPPMMNLSSLTGVNQVLGVSPTFCEDAAHETVPYGLKARRPHLTLSNNTQWAQNPLSIGEPQHKNACCATTEKKLAEVQKLLDESRDQIRTLVSSKRDALDVFKQLREKYDALRVSRKGALEQLSTLKLQNAELHDRYEKEKKMREKEYKETASLRRALDGLRSTSDHLKRSNESLLRQLRGSHVDMEELRTSVEETRERLKCSEHQLQLCDAEIKRRDASRHEALKQNLQYAELQMKCDKLEVALKQAQKADDERCRQVEMEVSRIKANYDDKQRLHDRERQESNLLLQDLNSSISAHKEKIKELSAIILKQDSLIQEQLQAIETQEEQIKQIRYTADSNNMRAEHLEKKLAEAEEHIRQTADNAAATAAYETELKETRQELEISRDTLLIKDKIIEDQVGTIQSLKNALNERAEELQKLSQQRDRERSKYKMALGELQVQTRRDGGNLIQQKQRILSCAQEDDHQRLTFKQMMAMKREKDHAVFTAHYVTKQLIQTVSEFERQVATQRKVHRMLISVLGDKEKLLNKITNTEGESISHKLDMRNQSEEQQRDEVMLKAISARDTCLAVLNKLPSGDLNLEKLEV